MSFNSVVWIVMLTDATISWSELVRTPGTAGYCEVIPGPSLISGLIKAPSMGQGPGSQDFRRPSVFRMAGRRIRDRAAERPPELCVDLATSCVAV